MGNEARRSRVPARRIHLVVAIDRLLARLLVSAPKGSWVVKGGYANQLRRPDAARFTEDLDLKIEAGLGEAPILLAGGFATDLGDGFAYEASTAARALDGPPGGGLRFAVAGRLMGDEFVHFKVDLSISDVVVGPLEQHLSDPVLQLLGFERSRFPVYPIAQHFAEKLHAFTLPRDQENSRARDLVDLVWFVEHFTFRSDALSEACEATFRARADHSWPPLLPVPPASWDRPFGRWRAELGLQPTTPSAARHAIEAFLEPVFRGRRGMTWDPTTATVNQPKARLIAMGTSASVLAKQGDEAAIAQARQVATADPSPWAWDLLAAVGLALGRPEVGAEAEAGAAASVRRPTS